MSAQTTTQIGLQPRPPVVAVVGHVDHGKTTLLDYIRKTNIAAKEVGGITQSIGAYEIEHPSTSLGQSPSARSGKVARITFIDTPGHKAFSSMRARGAAAADLAVLVVAADEGVKPQTTEAIEILKKTETPFIVALTKIDSPNVSIDKVKNELLGAGVLLEGYGGNISWHGVSGVTGEGINDLLDLIVLAGEVAELTFDPELKARGFVIESQKDNRRGIVAHLILKNGVLRAGELIFTPSTSGKIKILEDFLGRRMRELLPSAPALVIGFEDLPRTGEEFWIGEAKELTGVQIAPAQKVKPTIKEGEEPSFRVILKADAAGSLEALEQLLKGLVEIEAASVGEITDSDIKFAKSTDSVVVGFRSEPTKSTARLADSHQVKIITSDVIYKLVDAVSDSLKREEKKIGGALEVLAIFSVGRSKQTVGGKVMEGALRVGDNLQIERGEEVVGRGRVANLQQNKEDVKAVTEGNEAGLLIETSTLIEKGDILRVG